MARRSYSTWRRWPEKRGAQKRVFDLVETLRAHQATARWLGVGGVRNLARICLLVTSYHGISRRMASHESASGLPATLEQGVAGIPKFLIPASIRALDRLVGAAIDIPIAWLAQQRAKIDSQTLSYGMVEEAIAKTVATQAGGDTDTVKRAVEVLVRKSYRAQVNREAVAAAMLEDLSYQAHDAEPAPDEALPPLIDDDWLNVFERYAEDASTERMQKLWGRVLSGEVKKPGRYAMRTLRFLSEFSQGDALLFADYCNSTFGDFAPGNLVKPDDLKDLRGLIYLEAAGLIQGASGVGLSHNLTFDAQGNVQMREGNLVLALQGNPGVKITSPACVLTPLGQELLSLLPGRDPREAARRVAFAMRTPEIQSAYLAAVAESSQQLLIMEMLWRPDPVAEVVS